MDEPAGTWLALSYTKASAILELADDLSVSMTPAAISLAEKVRRALILTGFDPHIELHIFCTEEEQGFLEQIPERERGGGFTSSC